MATPQLSPGVVVREVDLTVGRADNVLANIGAIAGPFKFGPVEEAIDSGINEIIFITSPEKHSIKKHFKTNKDLELRLQNSSKEEMIEKLNPKKFSKVKFYYINQYEQNGLGHAVLQAESVIGNNSFAVMLPDDLFLSKKSCLDQLIDIFVEKKSSVIAVNKIDKNNIHKYGVIKPGEQNQRSIKIDDIVEKPAAEDAPSDMAVCGRYILNPAIFKHLKLTKSDKSGEIQLTDAIRSLLKDEDIYATIYNGEKFEVKIPPFSLDIPDQKRNLN